MISKQIFLTIIDKKDIKKMRELKSYDELVENAYFSNDLDYSVENIFRESYTLSYDYNYEWDKNISIRTGKKLFYKDDLNDLYEENELLVLSKFSIKYLIEKYEKEISSYYDNLSIQLDDLIYNTEITEQERISNIQEISVHLRSYYNEWRPSNKKYSNYNLDKDIRMTNTYKKDYLIYELISLYRDTDWNKKSIISFVI